MYQSGRALYGQFRYARCLLQSCRFSTNNNENAADNLSRQTLIKLERLSGFHFSSQKEIDDLRTEIRMAEEIFEVDTTGVEPLYSIVEAVIDCPLREDEPVIPDQSKIFANASRHVEGFFVAPPANLVAEESETLKNMKE